MGSGELAVTVASYGLGHVTYLNTYKDTPIEQWPHRRYARAVATIIRHVHRRVRIIAWNLVSILPIPVRRVTHGDGEAD